ncbi:nuclear transport factor 2 family protein [Nocardioides sp.]|uniref:nuclear transport factor 2 family protein n=1 Tax=Nocardioides sp. TaxID=35761 RepID=UPI001A2D36EE|nr:nuclear transport factor 2 family protein [Nocardioides sp.]MBJ7358520.1 nuclear transport factor 2 family protein [Nocardioides sp.]
MTPTELALAYAAYVDAADVDGLIGLFTPDCVLVVPDPPTRLDPVVEHRGAAGVRAALAPLASFASTRHEVGSAEVDGSAGVVLGTAHHVLEDGTDLRWEVRYDDEYRRHGDGWLIARRAVTALSIERIRP